MSQSQHFNKNEDFLASQDDQRIQDDRQKVKRPKANNLAQLLTSFCLHNISKVLTKRDTTNTPTKDEIAKRKRQLGSFLQENKAKSGQLILLFVYVYLQQKSADASQFARIKSMLLTYLQKKANDASSQTEHERQKLFTKIRINEILVKQYFGLQHPQIDPQFVKEICGQLYTGNQKKIIGKPVNKLIDLQKKVTSNNQKQMTNNQSFQLFLN